NRRAASITIDVLVKRSRFKADIALIISHDRIEGVEHRDVYDSERAGCSERPPLIRSQGGHARVISRISFQSDLAPKEESPRRVVAVPLTTIRRFPRPLLKTMARPQGTLRPRKNSQTQYQEREQDAI